MARAASQGAVIADEEFGFNSELLGIDFALVTETASRADVAAAAERLVDGGAFAVIGGFSTQEASVLSVWAEGRGVPFVNVGASADTLRNERCSATSFHMEPSAAMYLDAFVGWYVRSGFRQWYFVGQDTDESRSQYERIRWSMQERHFGAREVGHTVISSDAGGAVLADAIRSSQADVVMLLLSASDQLQVLGELEAAGITAATTGFPYPEAQTRAFFAASAKAAPTLGVGHRATAWEATIDAYGAREYNARYLLRWEEPMESAAWAVFHAVKILYEAGPVRRLRFGRGRHVLPPQRGLDLRSPQGDRRFISAMGQAAAAIALSGEDQRRSRKARWPWVLLVGELPAIYLPGTDLIERLDQLGDLEAQSRCAQ